jgi:antitoxin MazE
MYIPSGRDHSSSFEAMRRRESAMRATISKWGNSLGLRIPRGLAEDAGLTEGSVVELRVEDGRLVAEPVAVETLESLLARVTPRNRHRELLVDAPRGRETW